MKLIYGFYRNRVYSCAVEEILIETSPVIPWIDTTKRYTNFFENPAKAEKAVLQLVFTPNTFKEENLEALKADAIGPERQTYSVITRKDGILCEFSFYNTLATGICINAWEVVDDELLLNVGLDFSFDHCEFTLSEKNH